MNFLCSCSVKSLVKNVEYLADETPQGGVANKIDLINNSSFEWLPSGSQTPQYWTTNAGSQTGYSSTSHRWGSRSTQTHYRYGDTTAGEKVGLIYGLEVDGTAVISYTYDGLGQLSRKDSRTQNKTITYDTIGNPLNWKGRTLTWQHGQQLQHVEQGELY